MWSRENETLYFIVSMSGVYTAVFRAPYLQAAFVPQKASQLPFQQQVLVNEPQQICWAPLMSAHP